ncbi:MAG: cytochrome c [Myxococcaceae bacterium]|nr:cytochrome c [Myxococcaceae bacterium]MCA3013639.1 cytochrome c [Myxococcaceae bacterium]
MRRLALVVTMCMLAQSAPGQEPSRGVAKPPAVKKPAEEGLARPDYLSALARQTLRRRMERHGRDMTTLMTSVVLLKREVAQSLASNLASEPRITRPLPDGRDDLNAALPERFFVLQDELRDRARQLAETAKSGKDKDLGEAFARLTQTCVACHSAYLNPNGE